MPTRYVVPVKARNGALYLLASETGTRWDSGGSVGSIGRQQQHVLDALRDGPATRAQIRARLFPDSPLTASQRASFSRSLSRLIACGMVERDGHTYTLTEQGRQYLPLILFDLHPPAPWER